MIPVRPGPNQYVHEVGILSRLEGLLEEQGWSRGLLIHGGPSWEAAKPYFPHLFLKQCDAIAYIEHCTDREVNRLTQETTARSPDVIIGVGGGKAMDLSKAVANRTRLPHLLIPTLPATFIHPS